MSDAHGRVVAIAANAGGAALVATRPAPDEVELRRLGDGGVVHVLRRRHDPALAVSGHGLRAWNDGGDVVIDDGVAGPQPVPLEYQCTNLVWAGERVVAAAYNGLITVVEAVDGEWQPRRLPTRRRRVDELVGVGPAAVLLRRGREVALCPLDDPVREVILPEHADALAAVAMGDGRDVWWLTVAGEHPEALTWREVRSRS